jgi:Fe-Mn family superoxide dismutase
MKANAPAIQPDAASISGPQHVLPPLPYGYSALEACIDARTMTLHHDKHHAGYVDKLNELLLPYPELHEQSARWLLLNAESVPDAIRSAVQHNAGGHLNHSLLWQAMSPSGGAGPTGSLSAAISAAFGSLGQFQMEFEAAGAALFGSGWVWLVTESANETSVPRLQIVTTSGHDNPLQQGQYPLLVNDVWEHAYYLRYENKRLEYLKTWWSIVNWQNVVHRFEHPDKPTKVGHADRALRVQS